MDAVWLSSPRGEPPVHQLSAVATTTLSIAFDLQHSGARSCRIWKSIPSRRRLSFGERDGKWRWRGRLPDSSAKRCGGRLLQHKDCCSFDAVVRLSASCFGQTANPASIITERMVMLFRVCPLNAFMIKNSKDIICVGFIAFVSNRELTVPVQTSARYYPSPVRSDDSVDTLCCIVLTICLY